MATKTIPTTCLLCSPTTLPFPMINRKRCSPRPTTTPITCAAPRRRSSSSSDHHHYHETHDRSSSRGRHVDENMFVLRKRIHEITRMMEEEEDKVEESPSREHWMEWERRLYSSSYDSIICDAVGHLQSCLMQTRPSFALGAIALIALSLPTSTALLLYNLLELLAKALHHHSIQM